MNQIATLPLLSRQRMSLLPSPLKSPVSTIDQLVGAEPTAAACMTCAPFISQIAAASPLLSRHRISLLPSPLKSPVPTIDQLVGAFPTPAAWVTCAPFISQTATLPLVSCQRKNVAQAVAVEISGADDRPCDGDISDTRTRGLHAVQEPHRHIAAGVAPQPIGLAVAVALAVGVEVVGIDDCQRQAPGVVEAKFGEARFVRPVVMPWGPPTAVGPGTP